MISVILNWIYIIATAGTAGCAVLYPFYRFRGYRFKRLDSYFFAGLVTVTVYAQIYSLFSGVGLWANLFLLAACLLVNGLFGKKIWEMLSWTYFHEKKETKRNREAFLFCWGKRLLLCLLFLWFVYGTSAGFMMYDSNLYHAQSIRWIEEYGVVEGLGNLHNRLAYNSASFALTALYSMKFLFGQSLHTVAGLMAWFVFADGLRFLRAFARKKLLISDFFKGRCSLLCEYYFPGNDVSCFGLFYDAAYFLHYHKMGRSFGTGRKEHSALWSALCNFRICDYGQGVGRHYSAVGAETGLYADQRKAYEGNSGFSWAWNADCGSVLCKKCDHQRIFGLSLYES